MITDFAGSRPDKPGDQIHQGGLSRTVGADDPQQLTGLHLEGDDLQQAWTPPKDLERLDTFQDRGAMRSFFHLDPAFELLILSLDVMEDPFRQGHDEYHQEKRSK